MIDDSIQTAQSLLSETEDKAHDINHAERVAKNARCIGQQLDYPNIALLELCGWWHDVGRTVKDEGHEKISADMLREDLSQRGSNNTDVNIAYKAIVFHKWNMSPTTLEGNIIRDADKLDFISTERWRACMEAGQLQHLQDMKALVDQLPKLLVLKESRNMYSERVKAFNEAGVLQEI